jgi:hypothetical protein
MEPLVPAKLGRGAVSGRKSIMYHLMLAVALTQVAGCATLMRALLAPEQMMAQTASGFATATGQGLGNALAPTEADMAGTIGDLDRIMSAHPDAANIGELSSLKQQLQENQNAQYQARTKELLRQERRQSEPERVTPDDRYQPTKAATGFDRRDKETVTWRDPIIIGIKQPRQTPQPRIRLDSRPLIGTVLNEEHAHTNPFAEIRSSSMTPWQARTYALPASGVYLSR